MRRGNLQGDALAPAARPRVRRQGVRASENVRRQRAREHLNADEGWGLRWADNCGMSGGQLWYVGRTALGVHGLCARRTPVRTYIEGLNRERTEADE